MEASLRDVLSQFHLLERKPRRKGQAMGIVCSGPRAYPRLAQGLALWEHWKARMGNKQCLCRGREPLREEQILEHKSNEV